MSSVGRLVCSAVESLAADRLREAYRVCWNMPHNRRMLATHAKLMLPPPPPPSTPEVMAGWLQQEEEERGGCTPYVR